MNEMADARGYTSLQGYVHDSMIDRFTQAKVLHAADEPTLRANYGWCDTCPRIKPR